MIGVDRHTGKPLDGTAHLAQSIGDLLRTPIGTRTMRRDYGSLLPELVDAPANEATRLAVFAATAIALARWEPRIRLAKVALDLGEIAGQFLLLLEGARTDLPAQTDRALALSIPLDFTASTRA
jgi:uncharacterized protein